MQILHREKIVLLGMMTRIPVAGVIWQTMHYLEGFRRLGYDVYYVEAHGRNPMMLMQSDSDDPVGVAVQFLDRICRQFGFEHNWAYEDTVYTGDVHGMSKTQLAELYDSAAAIINLHGGTSPRPEHCARGRLVYLETDPVQLQIELHDGSQEAIDFLEPHSAFFTFGENYGKPGCLLPVSDRFHFHRTRQPVVMDFWSDHSFAPNNTFTTVGNWAQHEDKDVVFRGERYTWSKHLEFIKFLDLPQRAGGGTQFELALSRYDAAVEQMLRDKGWLVRPALSFSMEHEKYRQYICESRGEFTVAKDQNIRLRSGWFSDRSATYLAAGRPVITQETGFSEIFPTGEGLFGFTSLEQALAAVEAINSEYERHSKAAQAIAREYFDHEVVLSKMLSDLGIGRGRMMKKPKVGSAQSA